MHYLPCVLLRMLVFKLRSELFVRVCQERVRQRVLLLRLEHLRARHLPGLKSIELSRILVGTQIHAESELIFRVLSCLNEMMEVVRVANDVDV